VAQTHSWIADPLIAEGLNPTIAALIAQTLIIIAILLLSYVANFVAKRIILTGIARVIATTETRWDDILLEEQVFDRLSHLAPALVIYACTGIAFPEQADLQDVLARIAIAYMILVAAVVVDALLNGLLEIYRTLEISKTRTIKSYVDVAKLVVYLITAILVLAALLDRSPWAFLSGLGALTAVIMLVFKDTIMGFVASVQLIGHNLVKRGDWIEMPSYGADGDVVEIGLNTVKVQNFDKTMSTIPTYALISGTFKNWRSMFDSKGRRIKRAIMIDMHSIKVCSEELLDRFERVRLIAGLVKEKRAELETHNAELDIDPDIRINSRGLTNVGLFREYIKAYLNEKEYVIKDSDKTFLVRQLPPGEHGLPMEIYVFLDDTDWVGYEEKMADIFDHLLSVIHEFELSVFQIPTGADFRSLLSQNGEPGTI
jgi:miniconductance mechanosensitive channel|tara:strand:+ start:15646 stop:16929 length:1284 start_codon:yes stop_codon:yes gene_type:complete